MYAASGRPILKASADSSDKRSERGLASNRPVFARSFGSSPGIASTRRAPMLLAGNRTDAAMLFRSNPVNEKMLVAMGAPRRGHERLEAAGTWTGGPGSLPLPTPRQAPREETFKSDV